MKVFIVGLGLMGSSYAEKLNQKGYTVFGFDQNQEVNERALKDGLIASSDLTKISLSDLVILALYPKQNVEFLSKHRHLFNHMLVTDLSGTKSVMMQEILKVLPKGARYVSHHPMAGREKSGYQNRDISMFEGANYLIIPSKRSGAADLKVIETVGSDLGFKKMTILSPKKHDTLIAHTSQLTHLIAVSLMLSNKDQVTKDATGDSFRDLTRIAQINEGLWTELFLENKEALIQATESFIQTLSHLKELVSNDDVKALKKALKKAKEKRLSFDDPNLK